MPEEQNAATENGSAPSMVKSFMVQVDPVSGAAAVQTSPGIEEWTAQELTILRETVTQVTVLHGAKNGEEQPASQIEVPGLAIPNGHRASTA